MLSDSGSGSAAEEYTVDAVDVHRQLSSMLKPITKKQKTLAKRLEAVEKQLKKATAQQEEEPPAPRSALDDLSASTASRIQALTTEQSQCASKTALELARQEALQAEQKLQKALDDFRSRLAAQEMFYHGLEARVEAVERVQRTSESRLAAEVTAATSGLQTTNAAVERLRSEQEARVSEVSSRTHVVSEGLSARLHAEVERLEKQLGTAASQAQLADVRSAVDAGTDAGHNRVGPPPAPSACLRLALGLDSLGLGRRPAAEPRTSPRGAGRGACLRQEALSPPGRRSDSGPPAVWGLQAPTNCRSG